MLALLLTSFAVAVPTADCSQHVEGGSVTAKQREAVLRQSVRVHGATFFGLRNARSHHFDGSRSHRVWKAGLGVRAGAPMRIKVALGDRSWLALDYDRTDRSGKRRARGARGPMRPGHAAVQRRRGRGERDGLGRRLRRAARRLRDAAPAP